MNKQIISTLALALLPTAALAQFEVPNTFQAGSRARASEVNQNFGALSTFLAGVDQRIDDLDLTNPANVLTVATSGTEFSSVAAALASITDASATNRYLVRVAPGVYDETNLTRIPSFVVLAGSGPEACVLRTARSGNAPNEDAAAVTLADSAALQDITIQNRGAGTISIGVLSSNSSDLTQMRNVRVLVDGNGGTGHFAVNTAETNLRITSCRLEARGASQVNTAFSCIDDLAAFSQPTIENSLLLGEGPNSGFGMQLRNTAATVRGGVVQGALRAISANVAGISRIIDARVQTLGLNAVYEQSGSSAVLSAGVFFVGGNPQGLSSQFRYVHCYKANFAPVVNGDGSTVQ